jgi:hypothetical protein
MSHFIFLFEGSFHLLLMELILLHFDSNSSSSDEELLLKELTRSCY